MRIFREAVERYHASPHRQVENFFMPDEVELFTSIGYYPTELFPYIRDYATMGNPSPSTCLLIAAARRSFFNISQRGRRGQTQFLLESQLPRESETFQDIPYMPRLIRKAEAKLHGILDPSVMYYCEKDRTFLAEHGDIHPADFLYLVWHARGDKPKIISVILQATKSKSV